jgi:urea transport system permease protein
LLGLSFVLVTLFAPKGLAGLVDLVQGLRSPRRGGTPLGPDDGALQEREAVE